MKKFLLLLTLTVLPLALVACDNDNDNESTDNSGAEVETGQSGVPESDAILEIGTTFEFSGHEITIHSGFEVMQAEEVSESATEDRFFKIPATITNLRSNWPVEDFAYYAPGTDPFSLNDSIGARRYIGEDHYRAAMQDIEIGDTVETFFLLPDRGAGDYHITFWLSDIRFAVRVPIDL